MAGPMPRPMMPPVQAPMMPPPMQGPMMPPPMQGPMMPPPMQRPMMPPMQVPMGMYYLVYFLIARVHFFC